MNDEMKPAEGESWADFWIGQIIGATHNLSEALEIDDYVGIFTWSRYIRERLQWLEEGALMYILNIGLPPGFVRFKPSNPVLAEPKAQGEAGEKAA